MKIKPQSKTTLHIKSHCAAFNYRQIYKKYLQIISIISNHGHEIWQICKHPIYGAVAESTSKIATLTYT